MFDAMSRLKHWVRALTTEGRVGLALALLFGCIAVIATVSKPLGLGLPAAVLWIVLIAAIAGLLIGVWLLLDSGGVALQSPVRSPLRRRQASVSWPSERQSVGVGGGVRRKPPPGVATPQRLLPDDVTCQWPVAAATGAYYVGVWVNLIREVLIIVSSTEPTDGDFRVEGLGATNVRTAVTLDPWPMLWADGVEITRLRPGTYGAAIVGRLDVVGELARVLRLKTPHGELMLEPRGVGGRTPPPDQYMQSLKMLGVQFRVFSGDISEEWVLIIQFDMLKKIHLSVIDWPSQ